MEEINPGLKPTYDCDPLLNKDCNKHMCYLVGGPCNTTFNKDYALLTKRNYGDVNTLQVMFDKQRAFQTSLGTNLDNLSIQERVAYIKEHSIHLSQEINESLYELPFFKPWKDYTGMTVGEQELAMDKARKELIDAWHFFMNMALAMGFSPLSFYLEYMSKHKENYKRQEEGYTHDKQYR